MVCVISRIIKVELSVNQPWPSPQLMNTYLDLDYSGYHKKHSSNIVLFNNTMMITLIHNSLIVM